ncbi:MAG: type II and III secretion system protein family protein [Rickettsiales bacterium]|nr:type II and III secretion system protein family protein [Rickettsiales bacterium]
MMFSLKGTIMLKAICAATLLFLALAQSAVAAEELTVPVHRSVLINLPQSMSEVIVADPEVADIYPHGKNKLSIIGKKVGHTSVRAFSEDNKLIRSVEVTVGYDLPMIRKSLKDLMPYETIGVEMVNTNIALTGQVSGTLAAAQAVKIVDQFVAPEADAESTNESASKGEISSNVLNLMEVISGQQVMLRVRVGEIRRTALKNLGVNLQAVTNGSDTVFQLGTGFGRGLVSGAAGFGQFAIPSDNTFGAISGTFQNSDGDGLSGALQALEQNGLFKVLAEPNLVALSGEEAKFLAGGEFPILVPQSSGGGGGQGGANSSFVTVEFKPFGVSVKFKPTVLSENRIRMLVEPEVSELNPSNSVVLQGVSIPGLNTRRASTVIELSPGESFMIAGLINDNLRSTIQQVPGLGEIPILSALFRSTEFRREETELVLAVTPYLVDPLASSDVKLPTDNFAPASVMESFFYGALGSLNGDARRIGQTPQVEGPIGFMVD